MITGFILILIVLIPFTIYLYLSNKRLLEKINKLEKEKKEILTRKIKTNKDIDIYPINNISDNNIKTNLEIISNEIENKIKQEPIKLTDYEQQQEDNAIISYQELKQRNKLYRIDENDTPEIFIENLKEFRNNLNH